MATGVPCCGRRAWHTVTSTGFPVPSLGSSDTANDPVVPADPARLPASLDSIASHTTATHSNRNRRAPARYRDGADSDGPEFIDIHIAEESCASSVHPGLVSALVAAAAATTVPSNPGANAAIVAPIATGGRSRPLLTSADVHHFFKKSRSERTICNACQEQAGANGGEPTTFSHTTSNTSLRAHLASCHAVEYLELAEQNGWEIQIAAIRNAVAIGYTSETLCEALQRGLRLNELPPRCNPGNLQPGIVPSSKKMPALPEFSISALQEYLVKFIVADDQSINVVECPEFRQLLLLLREDLHDSDIPHRTKLRELIVQGWHDYFKVVKRDLADAPGKISFMTDIRSDSQLHPYVAITAHWIAVIGGSLKMKATLIAFHEFPGSHTGAALAALILALLDCAEVTVKVGHFTMDNASNNIAAMRELAKLLNARDIKFDPIDRRIPCFPHIINICVSHTIKAYTSADFSDVPSTWVNSLNVVVDKKEYLEALSTDPIAIAHNVVCTIRISGQCRKGLHDTIINGNSNQWYSGNPTQVPVDISNIFQAIDNFLAVPRGRNDELAKYLPLTLMQWEILQDLEVILEIPNVAQQYMSSESTPVLGWVIPAFELFMVQWEELSVKAPFCAPFLKVGLEHAAKYYQQLGQTRAYIVAMFVDPTVQLTWIDQRWGSTAAAKAREDLLALMTEYREKLSSLQTTTQDTAPATGITQPRLYSTLATRVYGLESIRVRAPPQSALQAVEQDSEFNAYVLAIPSPEGTHALSFWEIARTSFPTIYSIALDYLPIQASAVPCERVFSSSSETDTSKRNSIAPLFMEMLQMLKFWLKKSRLDFMKDWITPQKAMLSNEEEDDLLAQLFSQTNPSTIDEVLSAIADMEGDEVPDTTVVF